MEEISTFMNDNHGLVFFVLCSLFSALLTRMDNYFWSFSSLGLIKLRIVPPDAVGVLSPTVAGQVCLDVGSLLHGVNQLEDTVVLSRLAQLLDGLWESELSSVNTLSLVSRASSRGTGHGIQRT